MIVAWHALESVRPLIALSLMMLAGYMPEPPMPNSSTRVDCSPPELSISRDRRRLRDRVRGSPDRRRGRLGRSCVVPKCGCGYVSSLPARGELWWCEPPGIGRRPVVVLSRDAAIPRLGRALVAPCTTTIRGLPSEVVLDPGEDPIVRRSAVNLDSVESVSVAVLVERIGSLSGVRMREICQALEVATDCR